MKEAMPDTYTPRFDFNAKVQDCGREPGVHDYDRAAQAIDWPLVDYSHCPETPDQLALNAWLVRQPLAGKRVLHIGCGNSSVARLCGQAVQVLGVTVAPQELAHAQSQQLPNYTAVLCNKHSLEFAQQMREQQFDIVLDNNIASFACCQRHLERYMQALCDLLAPDGLILTHWLGMQWTLDVGVDDVETVWKLDADKLQRLAAAFGLGAQREGDVFVLQKGT
ncbi:class I SAM-dependent methyltransferase [Roseateles sp. BYS180W]|uniref:Class I SAM-dependent methyltransferase n=1 Tax=Roseateles rivi TaxID=3299028 RepID=A0ABW7FR51_9BURK